ncbi:homocysteine S-methyltransferase [Salipiger pallidus]|uniref:Homocysteine S-methyltransferase n=1 Tax=Salipiger pallidus TaxID=1775170 RepID=A0A8J3EGW5_9RHOB|nr:homocysteine S-methyltransferase family protein [Salipiger pallidus]GGG74055.1 homocysteine S-methyltransferase [Salipiger pallidus]
MVQGGAQITLLDGGLGRELMRFGAELTQPEWSAGALMDAPDAVRQAHEAFFRAGASIATANTYAVVPYHLGKDRFDARGAELAALAGRLAREAAEAVRDVRPGARVAGSLPPACGSYLPRNFDPVEGARILSVLVSALKPYADFWLAETMSSLTEARVTANAVAGTDKPLWISWSLRDDPGDDTRPPALRSGEPLVDAVALAVELGAGAVLFNCSMPEVMERAVRETRAQLDAAEQAISVGVYANAFTARGEDGAANEVLATIRDDLSPQAYLRWTERWVAAGATMIGGCCGIGAEHIAALQDRWVAV